MAIVTYYRLTTQDSVYGLKVKNSMVLYPQNDEMSFNLNGRYINDVLSMALKKKWQLVPVEDM